MRQAQCVGIGNGNKNCLLLSDIIDKVLSLTIENQILIAINFSLTALLTFGTLYLQQSFLAPVWLF